MDTSTRRISRIISGILLLVAVELNSVECDIKWRSGWRDSPLLNLFTVVQWGSGTCVAPSGEAGNCLPPGECQFRNGIPGGPCAGGYGTCCVFMATCGNTVRENGTYFVSPKHPDYYEGTGSCQLTINKMNPNICQFRLDFDTFMLAGPETQNHVCNSDQFLVSGGSPVPTICGTNTGEHMYIDAGMGISNPVTLTVITSGQAFNRLWRIRITQIECTSVSRADPGCLQYHSAVNGRIRSFNYDPSSGRQLSNQDYSVCIRTERNFCSIQYSACPDPVNNRSRAFTLSGNSNNQIMSMVGGGSNGMPNGCNSDWVMIGCAKVADKMVTNGACEDRICGGVFNAEMNSMERTVSSNVRPFRLSFHTDAVESPMDMDNRGFCLDYVQKPCTNGR